MLILRLEYAQGLCALLGEHPEFYRGMVSEPSLDIPEEYVLRWLLIFAWLSEGFPQIHRTLEMAQFCKPPDTPASPGGA